MAVTLGSYNNNLINPSSWTAGTGGVGIFNANGDANEQNRYVGTDPWGNSAMVWQCTSTGGNDASGGWNTSGVSIDQNALYRFSVWVRRTSATSGGTFYFGLQSSTGTAIHLGSDQGGNSNPYWDYRGTGALTQNVWYLFVGHCYPYYYNGTTPHVESGFYTAAGGTTKQGINAGNVPNDVKWAPGTTTGVHRCYHYYCTDTTTRIEFYMPRMDKRDGTEPTLAQLVSSPNPVVNSIVYSDGSVQSGTVNNSGSLISVVSFTNSGTWTKPTGCTKVIVKVVGGGGGAAGYCESGGAGGYSESIIDVTGVGTVAVTIGGGGGGVGYYAAAGNGGTSSFGSYCSATGGYGANQNYSHSGGHGGGASGGQVNLQGAAGRGHTNSVGSWSGGNGGWSYLGGGAAQMRNHSNLGSVYGKIVKGAPGSGGPGALTDGSGVQAGGSGEAGFVIVYAYT